MHKKKIILIRHGEAASTWDGDDRDPGLSKKGVDQAKSINDFTKGNLMIHPSWVAHSVFWNGGEPSHSISFDVSYDLPIGDKEYGSYRE